MLAENQITLSIVNDGVNGKDGKDGINGTDGKNGIDGKDGTDGKSAYQSAVEGGYSGSEATFNTELTDLPNKINTNDMNEALDGAKEDITTEMNGQIKESNDSLQSGIDELNRQLSEVEQYTQELGKYVTIVGMGIKIEGLNSSVYSIQDNDSYDFIDKVTGEKLLSLDVTNGATVPSIKIKKDITFNKWITQESEDGCLDDIYIG